MCTFIIQKLLFFATIFSYTFEFLSWRVFKNIEIPRLNPWQNIGNVKKFPRILVFGKITALEIIPMFSLPASNNNFFPFLFFRLCLVCIQKTWSIMSYIFFLDPHASSWFTRKEIALWWLWCQLSPTKCSWSGFCHII